MSRHRRSTGAPATDPESNYPLPFDLPVHPAGMVVDPIGGGVAWLFDRRPDFYEALKYRLALPNEVE